MAGASDRFSGAQRAAVVMMALGEQFTADMFKRMDQDDIRRVGVAMSNMDQVNPEIVDSLLKEFLEKLRSEIGPMIGGDATARRALQLALGEEGARALLAELDRAKEPVPFERIKYVDSKTLAGFRGPLLKQRVAFNAERS